jgi:hypothetical protein
MAEPLIAAMAPGLPLTANCRVVFEALDPASGAAVSGVKVTDPVLYGVDLSGTVGTTSTASAAEPLWVPLPANLFSSGSK